MPTIETIDPLNKLCKWRSVLAGWHIGTAALVDMQGKQTPGLQAMRDLMDKWLIMRAENNAIVALLVEQNVFTAEQFRTKLYREAALLDRDMERLFPGMCTGATGVVIYDADLATQTMAEKGFPE